MEQLINIAFNALVCNNYKMSATTASIFAECPEIYKVVTMKNPTTGEKAYSAVFQNFFEEEFVECDQYNMIHYIYSKLRDVVYNYFGLTCEVINEGNVDSQHIWRLRDWKSIDKIIIDNTDHIFELFDMAEEGINPFFGKGINDVDNPFISKCIGDMSCCIKNSWAYKHYSKEEIVSDDILKNKFRYFDEDGNLYKEYYDEAVEYDIINPWERMVDCIIALIMEKLELSFAKYTDEFPEYNPSATVALKNEFDTINNDNKANYKPFVQKYLTNENCVNILCKVKFSYEQAVKMGSCGLSTKEQRELNMVNKFIENFNGIDQLFTVIDYSGQEDLYYVIGAAIVNN